MAVRKWSCFIVYESTFASARRIRTPTSIIFLSDTDALMRNRNSQSETITFQTCYKNKTKTILPSRLRMHPPPPASNPSGILHPNRISYIRKIDSSGAESINFDVITLSLSLSLGVCIRTTGVRMETEVDGRPRNETKKAKRRLVNQPAYFIVYVMLLLNGGEVNS